MASTSHGTLTAGEVLTLSIEPGWIGIEIVNRDQDGVIWVRIDGEDPEVEGDGSYAVYGARQFPLRRSAAGRSLTVKLLSEQHCRYSVEAA